MRQKKVLSADEWALLASSETISLAPGVEVEIEPLSVEAWARILKWISETSETFRENGIFLEYLDRPSVLVRLLSIVMEKAPWVLAVASGLPEEDVKGLPAPAALALLEGVISVNQKNLDGFHQQMSSIVGKFQLLANAVPKPMARTEAE